eukprot:Gb_24145 [translate_table: standard]
MKMAAVGFAYKGILPFRPPLTSCIHKAQHSLTAEAVADAMAIPAPKIVGSNSFREMAGSVPSSRVEQVSVGYSDASEWKVLNAKDIGLPTSMITKPTWTVLKSLRKEGFEAYLVGGCVRDLLLKKTPKDFDIITTADPPEIKKRFSRCSIVGRRFPICHVHIKKLIVEVSSFSTSERRGHNRFKAFTKRPSGCNERDYARWKNCLRRDFTINGLMYDPYANLVYDYTGGMEDLKMAKVRTVIPAHASFEEDCARVLRAIRIAARLGFQFTRDTARAIQDFSLSILRLDKARLMMEMNYMLAFGAAEASLRLLWRFGLLEILLPIQASYFVSQGFRRRDKRSNMLLVLFANLDNLLAPDRPCHNSLWVGLLAFHLALVNEPQDAFVVTAFALTVRNGGNLEKAVSKARMNAKKANRFCPEVLEAVESVCDEAVIDQVLDLASAVKSSLDAMMNAKIISRAMSKYPQAPFSDLVFITIQTFEKVCGIFDCVGGRCEDVGRAKPSNTINYKSLVNGDLEEVRYVFAKVVINTLYSTLVDEQNEKGLL